MKDVFKHLMRDHKDAATDNLPGLLALASGHGMGTKFCPLCWETGR
jgi:hypothetical protein